MSPDDGPRPPDEPQSDEVTPESSADGSGAGDDPRDDRSESAGPSRDGGEKPGGPIRRIATATGGPLLVIRETTLSVGAVVAVGLLLFAISGVWPPMVAVESGSMDPHMQKGDLVFITDTDRFAPDAAVNDTGVVTHETGSEVGYRKFGGYGSVVVYDDPGSGGPPVIHRAQFWVDAGENWYDRADPDHISADSCESLPNCPAPHAGFVTKGDANGQYDQVNGISEPVKPEWIVGTARVRIPYLGWVRLGVSSLVIDTTRLGQPGVAGAGVAEAGIAETGAAELRTAPATVQPVARAS
jgi:signal peptidase